MEKEKQISVSATQTFIYKLLGGDAVIWGVVFLLSIISVLSVYSSTGSLAYKYQAGNTEYYLAKHVVILLMGIIIMYFIHKVHFTYFSRIGQLGIYIAIPLLLLTLLLGVNLNQASRWLMVPIINVSFQTSDLAKLFLMLYVARILAKKQKVIKDFKQAFIPLILPVLLTCGLILPANFSTAALLFAICLIMMFVGRINLKHLFGMIGVAIISFSIFVVLVKLIPDTFSGTRVSTWESRIENFIDAEDKTSYQVEQAKISIATGGLIGKAPGKSVQRNFLPHPYSDFIYAIIIEEYGLIGGVFIVLLYLILLYRSIRIASKIDSLFGSILALGCGLSVVFQAMINMGVTVNIFPVTGQALPLISMGGTSLWFSSITIGILLSISKACEKSTDFNAVGIINSGKIIK